MARFPTSRLSLTPCQEAAALVTAARPEEDQAKLLAQAAEETTTQLATLPELAHLARDSTA
jgi:hypothetical protein